MKVGVAVEYLDWQGNVEDSLARKDIFLEGAHHKFYNIVLGCDFRSVDQHQSSTFIDFEVVFEHQIVEGQFLPSWLNSDRQGSVLDSQVILGQPHQSLRVQLYLLFRVRDLCLLPSLLGQLLLCNLINDLAFLVIRDGVKLVILILRKQEGFKRLVE